MDKRNMCFFLFCLWIFSSFVLGFFIIIYLGAIEFMVLISTLFQQTSLYRFWISEQLSVDTIWDSVIYPVTQSWHKNARVIYWPLSHTSVWYPFFALSCFMSLWGIYFLARWKRFYSAKIHVGCSMCSFSNNALYIFVFLHEKRHIEKVSFISCIKLWTK